MSESMLDLLDGHLAVMTARRERMAGCLGRVLRDETRARLAAEFERLAADIAEGRAVRDELAQNVGR